MPDQSLRTAGIAVSALFVLFSLDRIRRRFARAVPGLPVPGTPRFEKLNAGDKKQLLELYPENVLPSSNYASLSNGKTHYFLFRGGQAVDPLSAPDPADGGLLVLIHGFSTPVPPYKETLLEISKRSPNLLVLAYDLFGRGRSDGASGGRYDMQLYLDQINQLFGSIPRLTKQVQVGFTLIGVSMGGSIATNYAARNPTKVRRLVLVAPAGLIEARGGLKLVQTPVLGQLLVDYFGSYLANRFLSAGRGDEDTKDMESEVAAANALLHLQRRLHPAYERALMSSAVEGVLTGQEKKFKELAKREHSPVVIWGTKDAVVPFELSEKMRKLVPEVKIEVIDGGSHDIFMLLPERMAEIVCSVIPTESK